MLNDKISPRKIIKILIYNLQYAVTAFAFSCNLTMAQQVSPFAPPDTGLNEKTTSNSMYGRVSDDLFDTGELAPQPKPTNLIKDILDDVNIGYYPYAGHLMTDGSLVGAGGDYLAKDPTGPLANMKHYNAYINATSVEYSLTRLTGIDGLSIGNFNFKNSSYMFGDFVAVKKMFNVGFGFSVGVAAGFDLLNSYREELPEFWTGKVNGRTATIPFPFAAAAVMNLNVGEATSFPMLDALNITGIVMPCKSIFSDASINHCRLAGTLGFGVNLGKMIDAVKTASDR